MNFKTVFRSLGIVLICEAVFMLPSLIVAMIYRGHDIASFLITILILLLVGLAMARIRPSDKHLYTRDGFAIVGLGWLLISFFGAFPFFISQSIPSFMDAFFESISGFTTTGASILKEIESLPKGILFWRSFTHWIGGMGVLVLTLAILPSVGARTLHIMRAESPGPTTEKLVPRMGQTAKILYGIYFMITAVEVVLLLTAGLSFYDALIHAFGTAGTGGFSNKNASVGAYHSVYVDAIITFFMFAFGVNFALYYQLLKGNVKAFWKDEEFRFYLGAFSVSILLVTLNIFRNIYPTFGEALRFAAFQVSSIMTTTGYATTDFNLWPQFSKMILIVLMFLGASAGSTGGGMKGIRILLLFKMIKKEVVKLIHPHSVSSVRMGGKAVNQETLSGVMAFFYMYIFVFVFSVLVVSLDGYDMVTTVSAVIATIGNIGPGLEMVGPTGNYAAFSVLSKIVLSICMVVGRLEVFPVLLLFAPSFWKRVNI